MKTREDYLSYHCPRWNEFPNLELYADQVLTIVQQNLDFFADDIEMTFTSNMINNYVKQKIVKPPINKKYDRVHLAYFTVVSLLKGFFSIPEICACIEFLMRSANAEELYSVFCNELEWSIKTVLSKDTELTPVYSGKLSVKEIEIIRAACLVFANYLLARHTINEVTLNKAK